MKQRIVLVVGDKFSAYVHGKDAITYSNLRGLLSLSIPLVPGQGRTVLVPGQGLSDANVRQLLEEAAQSPNLSQFDFTLWHSLPARAPASLTHKHRPENTLISVPVRQTVDTFTMHLLIDEQCELMQDHQSGQHVQGMILIEAARQGMLAVVEQYFLPDNEVDYAFVLNDMSVKYNNFAFPVSATIECRILEQSTDNPRKLSFVTEAVVQQCGMDVSSLTFTFAAMDKARIGKREATMAAKAQQAHLAFVDGQLQAQSAAAAYAEMLQRVDNF
ncbi:AfsA-related hotdog domain-containing protein [Marinimicrobium sp. C6131]|uniref:AfsA-related hotdog domain-containing protein n=1 Tax=Marinimicrobium sp. C6131 TaxID=3022676 RepID=UPI00223CCC77|nr:AfsA-related hotdog domain-containing protein [Marinimicrobium sp. C6131]UZJ44905.1 AfsA-related hotdog domain-containing protein [Marinimicrobium sp. C6131]